MAEQQPHDECDTGRETDPDPDAPHGMDTPSRHYARWEVGRAIGLAVDVTSATSAAQGRATHDTVMPIVDRVLTELAAAREQAAFFQTVVQRMETEHVTWIGPDGTEQHPDWCRECRVEQAQAESNRLATALAASHAQLDAALDACGPEHRRVGEAAGLTYTDAQDNVRRAIELAAGQNSPDDPRHVIEFREHGWTIKHPLACRPDLFDCPLNRAVEAQLTEPPAALGRFYIDLQDGQLLTGERLPAKAGHALDHHLVNLDPADEEVG